MRLNDMSRSYFCEANDVKGPVSRETPGLFERALTVRPQKIADRTPKENQEKL